MRLLLVLGLIAPLVLGAGSARADDAASDEAPAEEPSGDEASTAESAAEAEAILAIPPVDSLGRPFPDLKILDSTRGWIIGGAVMASAGGGLLLGGMALGSSIARGEIKTTTGSQGLRTRPDGGTYAELSPEAAAVIVLMGSGIGFTFVGVPLLSTGTFTRGQLKRTIKGAAKVPRTVANESAYWKGYMERQYGQALTVSGGGSILMGILAMVAVGATMGTEYHESWMWAVAASPFAAGAGMLIGGVALQKQGDKNMKRIWEEVDTYRAPETAAARTTTEAIAILRGRHFPGLFIGGPEAPIDDGCHPLLGETCSP